MPFVKRAMLLVIGCTLPFAGWSGFHPPAALAQDSTPTPVADAIAYDEVDANVPAISVPAPGDFEALVAAAKRAHDSKVAITGGQGAIVGGGGSIASCDGPFNFGRSKVLVNPPGVPFFEGGGSQGRINYRSDSREIAVTRHAFFAGSERDDDVISGFSVIRNAERHEWILLDVFRKEYFTVPLHSRSPLGPQAAASAAGSAAERIDGVVNVEPLGRRTIDGRETDAYAIARKLTVHLKNGTDQQRDTDFVAYVSWLRTPEPPCPLQERNPAYNAPEELALEGYYQPSGEPPVEIDEEQHGPRVPRGRLLLFIADKVDTARPSQYVHVTIRARVHPMDASADELFEVPSGYRRLSQAPPHSIFEARQRFAPSPTASP
jgi:hypothetical protein